MENHMENNFREIQKILDCCIAHAVSIPTIVGKITI